jgi:predicted dehydrogenase
MSRKIRYGMVGGGRRAFSSAPQKLRNSGEDLFLQPSRWYGTFEEMIKGEKALPADQRMDFVAIVTPNHMHFPPAKMALENGFHVLSDKPATFNLAEAKKLADLVKKTGQIYGLTHNYTGYPLVKQAREMVANGALWKIRKVVVEYPQGWLATRLEAGGQKQTAWCTDQKRSGAAGCIGDIGRHAAYLAVHITGVTISELAADLTSFVKDRKLNDDGNGFSGGEENNLNIRVYGEKSGLKRGSPFTDGGQCLGTRTAELVFASGALLFVAHSDCITRPCAKSTSPASSDTAGPPLLTSQYSSYYLPQTRRSHAA